MKPLAFVSHSPEQTQHVGEALGRLCSGATVFLLEGDLGSGKTCLVQGIAKGLGVPSEVAVNSPTYTLMNLYRGRFEIAHFDLYRLASADELIELDFDSYLRGEGVTIVEWPGLVDQHRLKGLHLQLDYGEEENDRTFLLTALDASGEDLLTDLAETRKEY